MYFPEYSPDGKSLNESRAVEDKLPQRWWKFGTKIGRGEKVKVDERRENRSGAHPIKIKPNFLLFCSTQNTKGRRKRLGQPPYMYDSWIQNGWERPRSVTWATRGNAVTWGTREKLPFWDDFLFWEAPADERQSELCRNAASISKKYQSSVRNYCLIWPSRSTTLRTCAHSSSTSKDATAFLGHLTYPSPFVRYPLNHHIFGDFGLPNGSYPDLSTTIKPKSPTRCWPASVAEQALTAKAVSTTGSRVSERQRRTLSRVPRHSKMLAHLSSRLPMRVPAWKAMTLQVLFGGAEFAAEKPRKRKPSKRAMEEEEQLMEALANAEEDDVPDDGAIEIDSDEEYRA
ncbi:hypothetical protein B0H14DRAFT_2656244 [Mycena olivaceomarginata]|nr:hypothetical protein B0H14DRAFT_2656244 [Mycena olivaceomarginata]